jgi:para-nitrobenzyl esterase
VDPVVTTRSGRLEGRERRGVLCFRGIPYAQAPRGALRWRAPQPPPPWNGVREAHRFGPSAPQAAPMVWVIRALLGGEDRQSQDCLHLNVFTPAADRRRRPVMVWIHGGAFVLGSGSSGLYDGSQLARRGDLVVVTLNYRLGALGFLDATSLVPGGVANAGLRDQIAALAWVRDNIEQFGGDPENVTIFGESAGGMSVGTLIGTPAAQGLFRRAICQSGAAHNVSSRQRARQIAELFVRELGGRDVAALERAPTLTVLAAQRDTAVRLGIAQGDLPWQPSVDGDLLPVAPLDAIAAGIAQGVPVLVGTNRDEWRLFMLGDRKGRALDEAGLRRRIARALPGEAPGGRPLADRAVDVYRGLDGRRLDSPRDRWEAFQGDRVFHHPAHRLAEAQSAHAPTFAYRFDWAPPGLRGALGACHAIEIPFVFGSLRDPALRALIPYAPRARALSARMQRAWIEFAHAGDPRHDGLREWPVYDAAERATLRLAPRTRVLPAPYADAVAFWSGVERALAARREAVGASAPLASTGG